MSINNDRIVDTNVDIDYKAIDANNQLTDLDIICNKCTVFDSKAKIVVKIFMRYDARNERFVCERCRRAVGEQTVRTALHLNQEEYIHYEPATPVAKTLQKRMDQENFIIKPNNPVPLNDPSRQPKAIVINNRKMEKKLNNNDDRETEFK
jgi:hypothetical protein